MSSHGDPTIWGRKSPELARSGDSTGSIPVVASKAVFGVSATPRTFTRRLASAVGRMRLTRPRWATGLRPRPRSSAANWRFSVRGPSHPCAVDSPAFTAFRGPSRGFNRWRPRVRTPEALPCASQRQSREQAAPVLRPIALDEGAMAPLTACVPVHAMTAAEQAICIPLRPTARTAS
jgi:hypothetical protein